MLRPKPNIARLVPVAHGGLDYLELKRLGILPEDVLDFSVSINPFGPPPGVRQAIRQAPIDTYPDSDAAELRTLLADKLNLSPDSFIIGSGSTELIRLLATAYFDTGDAVIIPQPAYGDYELACQLVGAEVLKPLMTEESGFRLSIADTVALVREHRPKGIFLTNPNNPTGQYLSREAVKAILAAATDSLVILDEAYLAFTDDAWPSLDLISRGNLVVLRSMTKDYALAGLRLGYAVAPEPIISVLKRTRPPWNVSSVAQAAGIAALKADDYLETCGTKMRKARAFLMEGLAKLGLSPLPSKANFFLLKVRDAAGLRQALLKHGILVRDGTSFGLPGYIRLGTRSITDCRRLLAVLKAPEVSRYAR